MMPSTQAPLISVMKKFGYTANNQGICAGLICMVAFAELADDEERFDKRIALINELHAGKITYENTTDVREMLRLIRDKVKKHKKLTAFEKNILAIDAFFADIELAHHTDRYREFFDVFIAKADVEKLSRIIGSQKITQLGGVEKVYSDPFIGNEKKLKDYLKKLSQILTDYEKEAGDKTNTRLSISLYSPLHRLRIKYLPDEKAWLLTDPNQLPTKKVPFKQIASEIIKAFHDQSTSAFDVQIFSVGSNPLLKSVRAQFDAFKQTRVITAKEAEKATKKTSVQTGGTRLIHVAAMHGDVKTLKQVSALNRKYLRVEDNDGYTPLLYAAQYGHEEALAFLASQNAHDLIKATALGFSPLDLIILNDHAHLVRTLVSYKEIWANLPKVESPLFKAARQVKLGVLFALVNQDANGLNQADDFGETPVHALVRGDIDGQVIEALAHHGADFMKSSAQGTTPLSLAAHRKKWDWVAIMLLHQPEGTATPKNLEAKALQAAALTYLQSLPDAEREHFIQGIKTKKNGLGQWLVSLSPAPEASSLRLFKESNTPFEKFIHELDQKFSAGGDLTL
ncbi:ankyrin repeat domain-containing protein [Legionella erythra]|nr:ankyrin repeat domain-containing protein [Legionella erythra]